MYGFLISTPAVVDALSTFDDEVIPLIRQGKISIREQRYTLEESGAAIADLHAGRNVGKPVIIVSEDED